MKYENWLFPYGLLKAGEVEDEVTPTYAIKRVNSITFDGTEGIVWAAWDWSDNVAFFDTGQSEKIREFYPAFHPMSLVCDTLPVGSAYGWLTSTENGIFPYVDNSALIVLKIIGATNSDSVNAWLRQHPVTIWYEINEAITVSYSNLSENIPPLLSAPLDVSLTSLSS